MDSIKPFFPVNNKVEKGNVVSLIITIIIYFAFALVAGIIIGVLSHIPIVGILTTIISALVELYCLIGLVLAIIKFLQ